MQDDLDFVEPFLSRREGAPQLNLRPDDFHNQVLIGRGKDSTIYSAQCDQLGGQTVAVKLYNKGRLSASKLRAIKREAAIMIYITRKQIPHVTRLHGAFQSSQQVWLVMELGEGGDLLEKLLADGQPMTEEHVCTKIAVPLLIALKHLHELHIIHRDLKLENIFLTKDGEVMLGDFGLTMSTKQELAVSPVGTVEYMAPEVVALPPVDAVARGLVRTSDLVPCTNRVDIWALGVTIYELLTGHLPFEGRDKTEVKRSIKAGRLRPLPLTLSSPAIDFIVSMLEYDAARRPSAAELLQHPFIKMHSGCSSLPPIPRHILRDDSANDTETAVLSDKKLVALQSLAELGRTSADSGPLIMARHGSPLAALTSCSSGGSSIASEIGPISERSPQASPPLSRMSRDRGRGSPSRMQNATSQELTASIAAMTRQQSAGRRAAPESAAFLPASPLRPSAKTAAPPATSPSPVSPGPLQKLTSFVKSLFSADAWESSPGPLSAR